jgi:hypothetical protein
MATTRLTFGEWTPDRPGVAGNMTDAMNVYPVGTGYASFPNKVTFGNAASETLLTVFGGRASGTSQLFAASASKIYKFDAATLNFSDVSKAGGYANAPTDVVQFGNALIAANNAEKLQAWTIGTSTAWADLAAAAPIAKFVTIVRDFVVSGYQSNNPNRVQWSDINDETDWTSGAASQADSQDIPDGGDIVGLTGGEFGLVFLQNSIHRMSYVGSPLFFQFDNISRGVGCAANGSIAQYKQVSFFLGDNGFYMCDGQTVTPIGAEKVDRWFFDNVDIQEIDNMSSQVDPERKLVIWNFKNVFNGYYQLMFQWELQRWSYSNIAITSIGGALTAGVTLEQLDNYGTVDSIEVSFDARQWAGGKFFVAGTFGSNVVSIDGTALTGNLVTGDLQMDGLNSVVTLARPIIDGGSASVSVASRKLLNADVSFNTAVAADSENRVSLRSAGKYHRIKVIPSGNWVTAVGVDVELAEQGTR